MRDDDLKKIQLLTREEVLKLLTMTPTTLWRLEKANLFPKKILLGKRRVAFRLTDIEQWVLESQQ